MQLRIERSRYRVQSVEFVWFGARVSWRLEFVGDQNPRSWRLMNRGVARMRVSSMELLALSDCLAAVGGAPPRMEGTVLVLRDHGAYRSGARHGHVLASRTHIILDGCGPRRVARIWGTERQILATMLAAGKDEWRWPLGVCDVDVDLDPDGNIVVLHGPLVIDDPEDGDRAWA